MVTDWHTQSQAPNGCEKKKKGKTGGAKEKVCQEGPNLLQWLKMIGKGRVFTYRVQGTKDPLSN